MRFATAAVFLAAASGLASASILPRAIVDLLPEPCQVKCTILDQLVVSNLTDETTVRSVCANDLPKINDCVTCLNSNTNNATASGFERMKDALEDVKDQCKELPSTAPTVSVRGAGALTALFAAGMFMLA